MLSNPTIDKLRELKLHGMIKAFEEQSASTEYNDLSFEERLGLLVDREYTERENRRLSSRLKQAKLRHAACMEDIDYRHKRSLDKSLMTSLFTCQWLKNKLNVIITGPTGVGKSFIACALGHRACLMGFKVLYFRTTRIFQNLCIAKGDGTYAKLMNSVSKADLIILDDWGLSPMSENEQRDFLEILEDRHDIHSTIITSQFPIENWHKTLGHPTLADAIMDRIVHNAYKLNLDGDSMRKKKSKLT